MTGPISMMIHVRISDADSPAIILRGRNAWALIMLVSAGERGCTYLDTPAPRWAVYIYNLRALGFDIEKITEAHRGPFPGPHARYVLRSSVIIVEQDLAGFTRLTIPSAIVRNGEAGDATSPHLKTRISELR
jgi:hypothetical protein